MNEQMMQLLQALMGKGGVGEGAPPTPTMQPPATPPDPTMNPQNQPAQSMTNPNAALGGNPLGGGGVGGGAGGMGMMNMMGAPKGFLQMLGNQGASMAPPTSPFNFGTMGQ